MNTSTGTSLSVFTNDGEQLILPRQRRRSNSSNDILAHASVKAVRSPRRDAAYNNIPRPPRLAYDTSSQVYAPIYSRTPPPSRQVCNRTDYGSPQGHSPYKNEINTTYRNGSSPSRGSRTTSFGSNTSSSSSRMSAGSQQVPSSLSAFYNERIEKTTSFDDDEDSAGEETMSCNSPIFDEYDDTFTVDSSLVQEVFLLRKEIDAVKNSLAGLQKDRVDTLIFFLQLEQQFQEAKIKEKIFFFLEAQEREYCERIRQFEAVISGQSIMIDQMEKQSISGSTTINTTGFFFLTGLNSINGGRRKSQDIARTINNMEHCHSSELVPSYCLSPPQTRIRSYANPALLFTDEERVRHHKRFSLAKRWVEDDEVSECQQAGCMIKFNWWNRRHHCRRCGNIFCSTHSAFSMLLFPDGSEDWGGVWSRVCEGCFKNT
ncbi:FYVE-domain-containing protein [Gigaspora margarita]|uniref:FYVE-domain-containing protein n=1 Tax=Gigaspora margarita TaxID=4874 RepID=A0A8H3X120_GIGMA|nr:FYVE-domain-containing protein [Gigaspora margarita]